jgi:AraC-like DNA-binding protein/quercetin dioxygenase-like cupin family protein
MNNKASVIEFSDHSKGFPIHVMNVVHGSGNVSVPHQHDFFELIFTYEGSGSQVISNRVYPMLQGDFFFIQPGETHSYNSDEELKIFNILIKDDCPGRPSMEEMFQLPGISEHFKPESPNCSHKVTLAPRHERTVRTLCQKMMTEIFNPDVGSSLAISNGLSEILLTLCRAASIFGFNQANSQLPLGPIHKALAILHKDFTNNLTVGEMAERVHLSPKYFGQLFREQCGISFQNAFHRRRVDLARELLENGKMNMTEIAMKVGYEDPNYFSRMFKKVCSMSPRHYRKMCQN